MRKGTGGVAVSEQIGAPVRAAGGAGLGRFGLADARLALPVTLFLLAIVLPIHFRLGPLQMTGPRLLLLMMIVPLVVNLFSGRYGRVLLIDLLFFAHILWASVALWVNNPNQVVTNAGSTGIEFLGGYMVGRAFIRSPADFVALVRWLAAIACAFLPFVIFETMTGRPLLLEIIGKIPGIGTVRPVHADQRLGLERVQAVFTHPIHSGLFFSSIFGLIFVGFRDVFERTTRFVIAGIAGLSGFLALSSGALLAIMLLCGLIGWAWLFEGHRRRWWYLVGLFAALYVAIDLLSNRPPIRVFLHYGTFSAHTAYWRTIIFEHGMNNVWANPLFGLGLRDWVRPAYMHSGSVDNFWLLTAMRYGIPGFATLAGGWLMALFLIARRDFAADRRLANLRLAWMFCMIGLTFTLCTVHVWHTVFSYVFFLFGAGIWMIAAEPAGAAAAAPQAAGPGRPGGVLRIDRSPERRALAPATARAAAPDRAETRAASAPRRPAAPGADPAGRAETRYSRFAPRPLPPRGPGPGRS
jgi:hypothetical protein